MTRHITDQTELRFEGKRFAAFMRIRRIQNQQARRMKLLDHPRPNGNGRFVQYLTIERGREV